MNPNPYVGPRPFDREDRDLFFGRDAEAAALEKLVAAQREVLIYSPAGAGKTSLLNARVIPALAARGLTVLPLARVSAPLPPGIEPEQVVNRFVYGALLSLNGAHADAHALLHLSLKDGLCLLLDRPAEKGRAETSEENKDAPVHTRRSARGPAQVVIFDQFEELFSAHAEHAAEVQNFMDQLSEALEAYPRLGVGLSLREDCLAELTPYLEALPGRRPWAHYRLEALSAAGALEAVTKPARVAGVPFGEGQAERLVEDLRRASGLLGDDDDPLEDLVPAVEPLLLQVVCSQLWANLPDDAKTASAEDLPGSARHDTPFQAFTDYYESAVRTAAAVGGVPVSEVRRWFSQKMITPQGRRAMASQDLLETGGLSNLAVLELEDRHLLVSHVWAGAHWYELAQDSFIEPIRASNQTWVQGRETPLRVTARLWKITGERGLLYSAGALKAARAWAESASVNGQGEVEPVEWEFIRASVKAERAAARLRGWLAVGIVGLLFLTFVSVVLAQSARQRASVARQAQLNVQKERATAVMSVDKANQQRAEALLAEENARQAAADAKRAAQLSASREFAAVGSQALDQNLPQTGLLLALQSIRASQKSGEQRSVVGEQALRDALGQVSGIPLQGHTLGINNLAASPDRRWLATVSDDGSLRLWDLNAALPGDSAIVLDPGQGWLSAVDFSPDSRWLAASGADSSIRIWDMSAANTADSAAQAAQQMAMQQPIVLKGHGGSIEGLRFSPDGRWLASGSADKTVRLWAVAQLPAGGQPVILNSPTDIVTLLAVSDDSRLVAAGARNGSVWVWNLQAKDIAASERQMALNDRISALTFSPDGRWLAAGGTDQRVVLWDLRLGDPDAQPLALGLHTGGVRSLAFSPDGCWLASGGADRRVFLWYMGGASSSERPGQIFYALAGHTGEVDSLAFPRMIGPRANYQAIRLVSGAADNTVRVWDLSPVAVEGTSCRRPPDADGAAQAMPDVRTTDFPVMTLRGLDGPVLALNIVSGNRWLAAAGADGSARLWDLRDLQTGVEPYQFNPNGIGHIYADAVSPDGLWLAVAGQHGVLTWSLKDPQAAPKTVGCTETGAYSLAAGVKGWMAAGCLDGSVLVWSASYLGGETAYTPSRLEGLRGVVYSVALSPDGQWLAAGDENGQLMTWRLVNGASQGAGQALMTDGGIVYSLAFDVKNRWLASADASGKVRLWNPAGGSSAALATFQASSAAAYILRQSADGRWLAAGTWDRAGVVRLWDMNAFTGGKEPPAFTLGGFINRVYALAFSPDGLWLAAGSADFTLRQWDLTRLAGLDPAQTPQPDPNVYASLFDDHRDLVFQAVYSPDGHWLLSASADGTIREWDTHDPQIRPVVFKDHTAWVRMLAVTPDGRYVISGSEDGTLRRWALSLDELERDACQETRRDLTTIEVTRYLHGSTPEPVCNSGL